MFLRERVLSVDRVVSFGQDISGVHFVSSTRHIHAASVMMLGVEASNEERIPTVLLMEDLRFEGADYRAHLDPKCGIRKC